MTVGVAGYVIGHDHRRHGPHGLHIAVAGHEPLKFAQALPVFIDIGLGEFAFNLDQHSFCGVDYQQVHLDALAVAVGRRARVKLVHGNAALLKQPHYGGAHLPLDKLAQAIAELAQLLIELLVLLFDELLRLLKLAIGLLASTIGFLEKALGFLETAPSFFLGFGEFAQDVPDVVSGGGHGEKLVALFFYYTS